MRKNEIQSFVEALEAKVFNEEQQSVLMSGEKMEEYIGGNGLSCSYTENGECRNSDNCYNSNNKGNCVNSGTCSSSKNGNVCGTGGGSGGGTGGGSGANRMGLFGFPGLDL